MEPVVGQVSLREYFARYLHHGRRQVECDFPDRLASAQPDLFQHGNDVVGICPLYHGYQGAGSAVTGGIGDHRIQLAAAEGRLINGYDGADVMFVQDPVLRVVKLAPLPEPAEHLLVLARQVGAVYAVMRPDGIYAFRRGVNPHLLKKPRTQG